MVRFSALIDCSMFNFALEEIFRRQFAVFGLERAAKLLASAFQEGIIAS